MKLNNRAIRRLLFIVGNDINVALVGATFSESLLFYLKISSHLLPFWNQTLLANPVFAAVLDQRLNGTGWTAELLANFLYNGPPEDRPAGMPPNDWRDVYNATTEILKLLSKFIGVC